VAGHCDQRKGKRSVLRATLPVGPHTLSFAFDPSLYSRRTEQMHFRLLALSASPIVFGNVLLWMTPVLGEALVSAWIVEIILAARELLLASIWSVSSQ